MGKNPNSRLRRKSFTIKSDKIFEINRQYYQNHAKEFINNTSSIDLNNLYKEFGERLPNKNVHVLDAGCGSGRDSAFFKRSGYKVTAIDASKAMVQSTRKLGIKARVLRLQDLNFINKFDGVWACAVLLHIPRNEIMEVIQKLFQALKPGGIILITIKEGHGERLAPDGRYFIYYGIKEFKSLLSQAGDWSNIFAKRTCDKKSGRWLNFLAQRKIKQNNISRVIK